MEAKKIFDKYLKMGEDYFEVKFKDGKTHFFLVDKEIIGDLDKKAHDIAELLEHQTDIKAILREAVRKLEPKEVEKLHKILVKRVREEKPVQAKTRENACADIKIGNFILPIVEG